MADTTTFATTNAPQNREDFKLFFLQLLEEDTVFYSQVIDKDTIKSVLEEILKERKPEWQNFLAELISKFVVKPSEKTPLDMVEIRQKYALKRETFEPLHELFAEAPTAYELTKRLSK